MTDFTLAGSRQPLNMPAAPFPADIPSGFEQLSAEPVYDPKRHLALEPPSQIVSLANLGYPAEVIRTQASSVAITSAFLFSQVKEYRR